MTSLDKKYGIQPGKNYEVMFMIDGKMKSGGAVLTSRSALNFAEHYEVMYRHGAELIFVEKMSNADLPHPALGGSQVLEERRT